MAKYLNFRIKASKNVFYNSAKQPLPGFEKVEYEDKQTKEKKVTYHYEKPFLRGIYRGCFLDETQFGEVLKLKLEVPSKDGEENFIILSIPVFRVGNQIADYAKGVALFLGNLKKGLETTVALSQEKDDKGYFYRSFIFTQDGKTVSWAFAPRGEESPVPPPTKVIDKVTKKEKWDYSDQDEFYYDILSSNKFNAIAVEDDSEEVTVLFSKAASVDKDESEDEAPEEKSKEENPFSNPESEEDDEDDDLPF